MPARYSRRQLVPLIAQVVFLVLPLPIFLLSNPPLWLQVPAATITVLAGVVWLWCFFDLRWSQPTDSNNGA